MNLAALTELASQLGALGVAVLVIWALLTERMVPRGRLKDKQQDIDDLKAQLELERARHERERP